MNRTEFIGLDLYYSQEFVDDRNKEIERLNNIINELEKYIISQMQEQETLKETKAPIYIFCKLQELKENKE